MCRVGQVSFGLSGVSDAEMLEAAQLAAQAIEIGKDDPDALWMGATPFHFSLERTGRPRAPPTAR